jgi:hypothetical protein
VNSLRLWISVLAGVCFLAGLAAGILLAPAILPERVPWPFAQYERRFAAEFDLDAQQARDLHYIMDRYHRDVEALQASQAEEIEPELVRLGEQCRSRIRSYVLEPEARGRFDILCAGAAPDAGRDDG